MKNFYFDPEFQQTLITWYQQHKRPLPWRQTNDPYQIWVAEIMLQQTQVNQVLPYFKRFVETFPNVRTLAKAPLAKILKVWEGMGYYARARNLHYAAQKIVEENGGRFPTTLEELLDLPGVGICTAAAVLSIAFNQNYPVIDGNVARVLCRLFSITADPRKAPGRKALWEIAKNLLPRGQVGLFNQTLMELGALICTPKNPQCISCPLRLWCQAQAFADPASLPVKAPRKAKPHYDVTAGIICKDGQILITLRPPKGLLGGLWEFPGGKKEPDETLEECLQREIKEELGIEIRVDEPLAAVKHTYSHFQITLYGFRCTYLRGNPQPLGC